MTAGEFTCLCERNQPGCENCARLALEAWQAFYVEHHDDTPGQLILRAIHEERPYVVLGILHNTPLDVNTACEPEIEDSPSPLEAALQVDNADLVRMILAQPALRLERALPELDAWSWAETCSPKTLEAFITHPAFDANYQDANGGTLLHAVARDAGGARAVNKLDFILQQGGVLVDTRMADGTTPLYQAALAGNLAAVERLLQHPVDVNNANTDNGWSVLMAAVAMGHTAIVAKLLEQPGIDANARDERQQTALHLAASEGAEQIVASLLAHPHIDVNPKDDMGQTPLMRAALHNHLGVARALLAHPHIQVNAVDMHRQTALYWATMAGQIEMVRLLLQHPQVNAHITSRSPKETAAGVAGVNAYGLATGLHKDEIAALLKEAMESRPLPDELAPGDSVPQPPPAPDEEPRIPKPFIPEPKRPPRRR